MMFNWLFWIVGAGMPQSLTGKKNNQKKINLQHGRTCQRSVCFRRNLYFFLFVYFVDAEAKEELHGVGSMFAHAFQQPSVIPQGFSLQNLPARWH